MSATPSAKIMSFPPPPPPPTEPAPLLDTAGGPPDDPDMEARMRAVEGAIIRIDTVLPTLATKADLASSVGELRKDINDQTWRMITWVSGIGAGLVTAAFVIARYVH